MKVAYVSSNMGRDGLPAFSKQIIAELDARGHEVLVYQHTDSEATNMYQLGQIKAAADRVFVDWVQSPLEVVLQQWGPDAAPVFVRCHRLEMYNVDFIRALPWQNVACLMFIAQHVQDRFLENSEAHPQRVANVGHVGVDLDFWTPGERPAGPPWRMVMAGNLVPKKRQYTAVQMLADLPETFHLDIIGSTGLSGYGNNEYGQNVSDLIEELGLKDRMYADKHLPPEQLRERLQSAHFVLNASNEEGCATVVAEGMACGCVPLVSCWRGVRDVYPAEWVWRSPKDLYRLCEEYAMLDPLARSVLHESMPGLVARYDAKAIARQVVDIITGPVDGASVGEWYSSDERFAATVEQYGNTRQQSALEASKGLLPADPAGVQVLDVGCSIGYLTHSLEAAGYRTIGVDVAERCLEWAREHGAGLFLQCDVTEGLPEGPFDLAAIVDCLEHIPAHLQQTLLVRALHVLKPGGTLLLRVPHGRTDRQIVETEVWPKLVRKVLVERGAEITRYAELGDGYFEIVARKAG